jgi:hypothetical protein
MNQLAPTQLNRGAYRNSGSTVHTTPDIDIGRIPAFVTIAGQSAKLAGRKEK